MRPLRRCSIRLCCGCRRPQGALQNQKKFDLVWFAKNRSRYPNHDKSKFLDTSQEHKEDIEKLRSHDCDYHHGMNCGVLAATRMFKEITKLIDHDGQENDPLKKVDEVKQSFPDLSVDH